jgi:hypothetical protein
MHTSARSLIAALLAIVISSPAMAINFQPTTYNTLGNNPISVAAGDFNGDGKLDLVVANNASANLSVFLNTGNGQFGTPTLINVGVSGSFPIFMVVGDVNSDGQLDVVTANLDNTVSVLLGHGDGTLTLLSRQTYASSSGPMTSVDFNGDGKLDLAIVRNDQKSSTLTILLGKGDGTFVLGPTGLGPYSVMNITAADVNGDGKPDFVLACTATEGFDPSLVAVILNTGKGLSAATSYKTPAFSGPNATVVGDFNEDGIVDIAAADSLFGVSLFKGKGNGTFSMPRTIQLDNVPLQIATTDLNKDGHLDLILSCGLSNACILPGRGNGTFGKAILVPVGDIPNAITVAEFNGDGRPDFAIANYDFTGTMTVVLNQK